jgi:hypothetical protein
MLSWVVNPRHALRLSSPGTCVPLNLQLSTFNFSPCNSFTSFSVCTIFVQYKFFRINTCKSVSKQMTLTPFRMNTYEKRGEGGAPDCDSSQRRSFFRLLPLTPQQRSVDSVQRAVRT